VTTGDPGAPHASPIDEAEFDALLELLGRASMRDVITMFAASAPARLAAAAAGVAGSDTPAVVLAFHSLRSGCGQLGARELERACADGERSAKAGNFSEALRQLTTAAVEYTRCVDWFRAHGWLAA
jgi:HPt (histidine-containing phosphotransfer) domain-containing protein